MNALVSPSLESISEIDYPVEEKLGQGKKHELRFRKLIDFLEVLFENNREVFIGGDRFFYYEEGNKHKSVAPDAFVVKNYDDDEPDVFKVWETPVDLRFACEIWSPANSDLEIRNKFSVYRDVLAAAEYCELTTDERLLGYRLTKEGDYVAIQPNKHGRLLFKELNAELAFEDGLIRVYQNGKRIPTLQELWGKKLRTSKKNERRKKNSR
jgi:Uma2 family endonuclease